LPLDRWRQRYNLNDVKKALDTGAVSKEEYETLRQRILSPRPDK
jgi:hypothetical protein